MKWIFVGHRGVGKTTLLQNLRALRPSATYYDLDEEIRRRSGRSVASFFDQGESAEFRQKEVEIFRQIIRETENLRECFIALGAGFQVKILSEVQGWRVVWIRRLSDSTGRIFFDRPRLDLAKTAGREFLDRKVLRDPGFERVADEVLDLPEGNFYSENVLQKIFEPHFRVPGAGLTLLSHHRKKPFRFVPDFIELRSDLLNEIEIQTIAPEILGQKSNSHFRAWSAAVE